MVGGGDVFKANAVNKVDAGQEEEAVQKRLPASVNLALKHGSENK